VARVHQGAGSICHGSMTAVRFHRMTESNAGALATVRLNLRKGYGPSYDWPSTF
jgi:hypothetical protein